MTIGAHENQVLDLVHPHLRIWFNVVYLKCRDRRLSAEGALRAELLEHSLLETAGQCCSVSHFPTVRPKKEKDSESIF